MGQPACYTPSMGEQTGAQPKSSRLIWLDMEMTGLDPDKERIIEVAVLITDGDLNLVAEGPSLVVHQPDALLDAMDEWNTQHHGASGLIDRVKQSTIDEGQAEQAILAFVREHCTPNACPLAGNSIHQDRRFVRRFMPEFDAFLHYRLLDVTTVKELARRWYPEVFDAAPKKKESHRALDDIRESIAELAYYRQHMFAPANP